MAVGSLWKTRDGTTVLIRFIRPEDEPAMVRFHQTLSSHAVYSRYFHVLPLLRRIAHETLAQSCQNDQSNTALVAQSLSDPPEILAVARLIKNPTSNDAELSLIVRDCDQHKGLGTELMLQLLRIAKERSLKCLTMEVLRENIEMQDMAVRLGFVARGDNGSDATQYVRESAIAG